MQQGCNPTVPWPKFVCNFLFAPFDPQCFEILVYGFAILATSAIILQFCNLPFVLNHFLHCMPPSNCKLYCHKLLCNWCQFVLLCAIQFLQVHQHNALPAQFCFFFLQFAKAFATILPSSCNPFLCHLQFCNANGNFANFALCLPKFFFCCNVLPGVFAIFFAQSPICCIWGPGPIVQLTANCN